MVSIATTAVGTGLEGSVGVRDIPGAAYHLPPRPSSLLPREDLVEGLLGAEPIVEVVAPAGYGKTSTLLLWEEADARRFAWVQLGAADDDAVHLGRHVALALGTLEHVGEDDSGRLVGASRSAALDVFPTVARLWEERSPCVLVLDDVHLVSSPTSVRGLEALLTAVPEGSHLALVGRHLPVHLARHRLSGRVHQLTAAELAMTPTDAASLFSRAGLSLAADQAADLVARTEGWPGGLHLASLAMGQGQGFESFSGRHRLVGDYLVEEVLASTSVDMVEFLQRSAVVDQLDAELLDALLERSDSGQRLAAIAASGNLFLVALDDEGRQFRYHHLFGELLRDRLRRDDPRLAKRLHSRASVLLERRLDIDGAVRHAISAEEHDRAANLILAAALARFFDGRAAQLGEWLGLLPDDAVERIPAAAVATAWHRLMVGDHPGVLQATQAADRFGDHGPLADGSPSLPVAMAVIRILLGADGVQGVIDDSELAREAGGPTWNPWWAFATAAQGSAYLMLGELDLARDRLVAALHAPASGPYLTAAVHAHLALLSLWEHDLVEAVRLAAIGREVADANNLDGYLPAMSVYGVAALVAARSHRVEEARSAAACARSTVVRLGNLSPRTSVFGLLLLAQTSLALNDRAEARVLLREAQRARRRDQSATLLNAQLDELAEQLNSAGDLVRVDVQPLTTAERRVLDYLPTHLSLQEIAAELLISRNTAKSHSVAIYRKLGVGSRAEAVTAARQIGLLQAP
jgi:LuxR family maltose regulon positive regulatory protein